MSPSTTNSVFHYLNNYLENITYNSVKYSLFLPRFLFSMSKFLCYYLISDNFSTFSCPYWHRLPPILPLISSNSRSQTLLTRSLVDKIASIFPNTDIMAASSASSIVTVRYLIEHVLITSAAPRTFVRGEGGVQQIQLRTDGRENEDLEAVAP
jgi:hypothetical protein